MNIGLREVYTKLLTDPLVSCQVFCVSSHSAILQILTNPLPEVN